MFALLRGLTLPKLKEDNSMYYPFFCEDDTSLYLKEDISRGCVHHYCVEWFNSPCIEGIIFVDVSNSCNQDLIC